MYVHVWLNSSVLPKLRVQLGILRGCDFFWEGGEGGEAYNHIKTFGPAHSHIKENQQ